MKVRSILETCLYADDLEAAEKFYSNVMGLETVASEVGRYVFFRCGDGVLLIFNPTATSELDGEIPPHGGTGAGHVAFCTDYDDFPEWRERLAEHKVPIETEYTWDHESKAHSIYFRDPAGNSLELATAALWR